MKQPRRTGYKSKRSGENHMQLILLLFEMTIKDNGYVSRQLDQQCEEKKLQYRKKLKYKAIAKRKKKIPSVGPLETSPHTSKFDLNIFLFKFCQTSD